MRTTTRRRWRTPASGGDYAGETASLAVTVTDDETPEPAGIVLSTSSLGVAEGEDATYTVRLSTEPTAQVTVAVTGHSGTDLTLDTASLTFTTATWNTAQTVTVTAGEDDDADNDTATLLHTASGGDYAGETASVAVTVTDDETPEPAPDRAVALHADGGRRERGRLHGAAGDRADSDGDGGGHGHFGWCVGCHRRKATRRGRSASVGRCATNAPPSSTSSHSTAWNESSDAWKPAP